MCFFATSVLFEIGQFDACPDPLCDHSGRDFAQSRYIRTRSEGPSGRAGKGGRSRRAVAKWPGVRMLMRIRTGCIRNRKNEKLRGKEVIAKNNICGERK